MRSIFIAFFFIAGIFQSANASLEFNENCKKAYEKILHLRFNEARMMIAKERLINPSNNIPVLLDNYIDCFTIFAGENLADFNRLKVNKAARLKILEKENKNSPYYRFCLAEVNLQWALAHTKFEEYIAGGLEIKRAYDLLEENYKLYPGFLLQNKSLGMLYTLLGSVPDGLKTALNLFGMKGNVAKGKQMVIELIETKDPRYSFFYEETIFYYCFMGIDFLNDANIYVKMLNYYKSVSNESVLKSYIKSYISLKTGHADMAISTLAARPTGPEYYPFHHLDYIMGIAKLSRRDKDANIYLTRFINNYKGVFYIKDAYLKLAWYYLFESDLPKYREYIINCKTKGYVIAEKDQQALKEASIPHIPNLILLLARLYYDGGYYEKALNTLKDKKAEEFSSDAEKLEHSYRLGRIHHAMGNQDLAIQYYVATINAGLTRSEYFAANSALQMGLIYENRNNFEKAAFYFKLCISMKNHEYKNSFDNKAKAGLSRIKP